MLSSGHGTVQRTPSDVEGGIMERGGQGVRGLSAIFPAGPSTS